ncbi:MAG: cytochrome c3 family protein [Deltaproteobacteria bacterium]|nr:cytochrome c3 family protein [Deltaproteobacteria bacterium]
MDKKMRIISIGVGLLGVAFILPCSVMGKAAGPCVDCHTMHNSQDGADLFDSPSGALTNGGCIGCHTGTNTVAGNIPYVLSSGAPTYGTNTLAGGNFYWVLTDDTTGHNVIGLEAGVNADVNLDYDPPGWNPDFNANTQVNSGNGAWATQLTCAGTYGCHGEHVKGGSTVDDFTAISGSHHGDDSTLDGSTTAKSFRFLYGIIGKEDTNWEFDSSSIDHNQYYGVHRASDTMPASGSEGAKSINYLCAECHGNFHSGAGNLGADTGVEAAAAWIRHPTDYDMNVLGAGTEYKSYGTDGTYLPIAPVATNRKTGAVVTVTVSNVFANAGDAIVNCISCHRAHGSPYADLLRWDYDTCQAGSDNGACGCFECHTTKDAG